AEEARNRLFQLAMQGLGAADEAHRGHAEATGAERGGRRGPDTGMVGEAEIIVGAEVQHLAGAAVRLVDRDPTALRAGDQALALVEAGRLDLLESAADMVEKTCLHQFHSSGVARL